MTPPPEIRPGSVRATGRRIPSQERSRTRVTAILDAAAELVLDVGVDLVTTRAVAERAQMPPASLYQYFADRDAVLLGLIGRGMQELDRDVERTLSQLRDPDLEAVVTAAMDSHLAVYRARPSLAVAYLRGRTNRAVNRYARQHCGRLARTLYDFGRSTGLLRASADVRHVRLAVEVADQIFQYAFARDLQGEEFVLREGMTLMTGYLRPHTISPG